MKTRLIGSVVPINHARNLSYRTFVVFEPHLPYKNGQRVQSITFKLSILAREMLPNMFFLFLFWMSYLLMVLGKLPHFSNFKISWVRYQHSWITHACFWYSCTYVGRLKRASKWFETEKRDLCWRKGFPTLSLHVYVTPNSGPKWPPLQMVETEEPGILGTQVDYTIVTIVWSWEKNMIVFIQIRSLKPCKDISTLDCRIHSSRGAF